MIKDPLEYTNEELLALPTEILEQLLATAEYKESFYHTSQLVQKTLINSLYGALANKYFTLFNEDMAAAITGNGRFFIQKTANMVEDALQKLNPSQKPYIVYGDTDSVLGSTLIKTDRGDIKIEDLYNNLNGNIDKIREDNFVKNVSDMIKAGSVSENLSYEEKQITYVMKHKVKKRMFKIKCNGDEVTITEDHSMMVIRDNKLIEIKPKDIQKNDKLVKIKK